MTGTASVVFSSPKSLLLALVISAAGVAGWQFFPTLQELATPAASASPIVQAAPQPTASVRQEPYGVTTAARPIPSASQAGENGGLPDGASISPAPVLAAQPGDAPAGVPDAESVQIEVSVPASGASGSVAATEFLRPTFAWINAFGLSSIFNGRPLAAGDIVTAYDPEGNLIGRATVTTAGSYGLMALYMDDPSTAVDEGAEPGDLVNFKINGVTAAVIGPQAPVWTDNGAVLQLNLTASGRE
jgi:hypothetical protein